MRGFFSTPAVDRIVESLDQQPHFDKIWQSTQRNVGPKLSKQLFIASLEYVNIFPFLTQTPIIIIVGQHKIFPLNFELSLMLNPCKFNLNHEYVEYPSKLPKKKAVLIASNRTPRVFVHEKSIKSPTKSKKTSVIKWRAFLMSKCFSMVIQKKTNHPETKAYNRILPG